MKRGWIHESIFTLMLPFVGAIFLVLISLTPSNIIDENIALVVISSTAGDGRSVTLGLFRTCARDSTDTSRRCTNPVAPNYDLSGLPFSNILEPPGAGPVIVAIVFVSVLCFIQWIVSLQHILVQRFRPVDAKPKVRRMICLYSTIAGCAIGLFTFLVHHIWYRKATLAFNSTIGSQKHQGPEFTARIGDAFILAWVAEGLLAVPAIFLMIPTADSSPVLRLTRRNSSPIPPLYWPPPTHPTTRPTTRPTNPGPPPPPNAPVPSASSRLATVAGSSKSQSSTISRSTHYETARSQFSLSPQPRIPTNPSVYSRARTPTNSEGQHTNAGSFMRRENKVWEGGSWIMPYVNSEVSSRSDISGDFAELEGASDWAYSLKRTGEGTVWSEST